MKSASIDTYISSHCNKSVLADIVKSHGDKRPELYSCTLVSLRDSAAQVRQDYIRSVFGQVHTIGYQESAMFECAKSIANHRFLVVSGRDVPRIQRIMRNLVGLASERPKICVVNNLAPTRRMALMKAGFDDVFDIDMMPVAEATCKVRSFGQLYVDHGGTGRQSARKKDIIDEISLADRLTGLERAVLTALVKSPDSCLTHDALRNVAGRDGNPASMPHVRVILSGIRKKLREGVTITAFPHTGYELTLGPRNGA